MTVDGNTLFSSASTKAVQRIRALRTFTQETGIQTRDEQIKIVLGLDNEDLLDVVKALKLNAVAR
jgi:hypothetical protein